MIYSICQSVYISDIHVPPAGVFGGLWEYTARAAVTDIHLLPMVYILHVATACEGFLAKITPARGLRLLKARVNASQVIILTVPFILVDP